MKSFCTFVCCLVLLLGMAWSQTPQSPELKKLDELSGKWTCSGESRITPGIKTSASFECSWEKSGKILFCQQQFQVDKTASADIMAFTFDTSSQIYVGTTLSSIGFPAVYTGSIQDGKWNFAREGTWQGKMAKYEFSRVNIGKGEATFAWRRSVAGGPWVPTSEGKCTRSN